MAAVQLQSDQNCDQTSIRAPQAHEVQFALSLAKEADRPIKDQAWEAYASSGQIGLRPHAEGIRRSQSGHAA